MLREWERRSMRVTMAVGLELEKSNFLFDQIDKTNNYLQESFPVL
jgi:hypothetical protein